MLPHTRHIYYWKAGNIVERIAQLNRFDIVFTVRAKGTNHRLLFSADPECARMQLGG